MSGYANPYTILQFPELGDDVSVLLRNPQLLPPDMVTPEDVPLREDGQPVNPQDATNAMFKVMAGIIVAWKVYEAFGDNEPEIAEDADPVELMQTLADAGGEQKRIGAITSENVAKLPLTIVNAIGKELNRVADPK